MSQNKKGFLFSNNRPNLNLSEGHIAAPQRIRLRRNVTKQQLIQQNLSHMQQSAQKKKVAQELYYSQHDSRSPLLRKNTPDIKTPVHNRLGHSKEVHNIQRQQAVQTPRVQPGKRIKLRKQMLQPDQVIRNNIIKRKNDRMLKSSAQNRILRIRQQGNLNQSKLITQQSGQKLRLRRMRPTPVNYTVQVVNNNKAKQQSLKHSVSNVLTPKLQEEIRQIQNKAVKLTEIPSIPICPQGTGYTGTTLHERFSQL